MSAGETPQCFVAALATRRAPPQDARGKLVAVITMLGFAVAFAIHTLD